MLRRDRVAHGDPLVDVRDNDHSAVREGRAGDVAGREIAELALERGVDPRGEAGIRGHEQRDGRRVVLRLRQEIGGDALGVRGAVGEHREFRRTGEHIDRCGPGDELFRSRDIAVSRADDDVTRRDRTSAVGEGRDRMRAASGQ